MKILVVDQDPAACAELARRLSAHGHDPSTAPDLETAIKWLRTESFDLALVASTKNRNRPLELLRWVTRDPDLTTDVVIVRTGGTIPEAVEAVKLGAFDFLPTPINDRTLCRLLDDARRQLAEKRTMKRISIDPITRLEGHGKIDIFLANSEYVDLIKSDAYTHETYNMGTVDKNNRVNFYDGQIRVVGPDGRERFKYDPRDYEEYIAERVEPWSYLKFPYLKKVGWKGLVDGIEAADLVHFGDGCTPDVAAAIPRAALEVVHLLSWTAPLSSQYKPVRLRGKQYGNTTHSI